MLSRIPYFFTILSFPDFGKLSKSITNYLRFFYLAQLPKNDKNFSTFWRKLLTFGEKYDIIIFGFNRRKLHIIYHIVGY